MANMKNVDSQGWLPAQKMAIMESPVVNVVFVDGLVGQGEEQDEEDGEAKREHAHQKITLFWLLVDQFHLLVRDTFQHVPDVTF